MIGQEAAAAAAVGSATIFITIDSSINNAITHQHSLAVALTVDSVAAITSSSAATTAASTTTYYQQLGPIVRQ